MQYLSNVKSNHTHQFDEGNPLAQKKILIATILTGVMMVFEIFGGWFFNSMALLADGWHMSSHMLALGLAYFAYRMARKYSQDQRFCFGTWKIEILAGYSSAILLMVVALFMGIQSVERLFNPVNIHYNEAISIAVIGLAVNFICAWLLHDSGHHHHHHHEHDHHHDHGHHHHDEDGHHEHDLNQKAAFLHVVADAVTSVLAIIALFAGKFFAVAPIKMEKLPAAAPAEHKIPRVSIKVKSVLAKGVKISPKDIINAHKTKTPKEPFLSATAPNIG